MPPRVTNPRILETRFDWPPSGVWSTRPPNQHRAVFALPVAAAGGGANLIPDRHLAALAIEHGLELCSTDGDFARFPNLRWHSPLKL